MDVDADLRAYDALSRHEHLPDLAAVARGVLTNAVESRAAGASQRATGLAAERGLKREDAATPFGNALTVLERGPESDAERSLARALAAHAIVASSSPDSADAERQAGQILWLASHTAFDATGLVDRALGADAGVVWEAVARRVRLAEEGRLPSFTRGEALVATVALGASTAAAASKVAAALTTDIRGDRQLAHALAGRGSFEQWPEAHGEVTPRPRGPATAAVLGLTGISLALRVARAVARLALGYKTPAEVVVSEDGGIRVRWRTELLGRTLRDCNVLIPRAALASATRDVRYPGLALYAGLFALVVGSYVGVSAFVDGVRAASPSLLAAGLAIVALGLGLDFGLSSFAPGRRGRCRVLFVPRRGSSLCIGGVDIATADAVLDRLAKW